MSDEDITFTVKNVQNPKNKLEPVTEEGRIPGGYKSGGGRPALDPSQKVSVNMRALYTPGLAKLFEEISEAQMINISDFLRLGVYTYLVEYYKKKGEALPDWIRKDPTWDKLRGQGFI